MPPLAAIDTAPVVAALPASIPLAKPLIAPVAFTVTAPKPDVTPARTGTEPATSVPAFAVMPTPLPGTLAVTAPVCTKTAPVPAVMAWTPLAAVIGPVRLTITLPGPAALVMLASTPS